jgi:hypothetical protein
MRRTRVGHVGRAVVGRDNTISWIRPRSSGGWQEYKNVRNWSNRHQPANRISKQKNKRPGPWPPRCNDKRINSSTAHLRGLSCLLSAMIVDRNRPSWLPALSFVKQLDWVLSNLFCACDCPCRCAAATAAANERGPRFPQSSNCPCAGGHSPGTLAGFGWRLISTRAARNVNIWRGVDDSFGGVAV